MSTKPDWDALGRLFEQPKEISEYCGQIDAEKGHKTYLGEALPRWLVRDLMQERAAIREHDGGMTKQEAEALTKSGLRRVNHYHSKVA